MSVIKQIFATVFLCFIFTPVPAIAQREGEATSTAEDFQVLREAMLTKDTEWCDGTAEWTCFTEPPWDGIYRYTRLCPEGCSPKRRHYGEACSIKGDKETEPCKRDTSTE